MKKFLLAFLLLSCQQKSVPVISTRKADPPRKLQTVYPPVAAVAVDTAAGKQLFTAKCDRCHGLPLPQQFTKERWDDILPLMFPRSGFSNEEAFQVRAYVLALAAR